MIRVRLFISGRVQGVFFRSTMCQKAKKVGINGFVRNIPDGRVEAVLEGEEDKVEKLIKWARRGPIFAKVDNIKIEKEDYVGEFKDFNIEY